MTDGREEPIGAAYLGDGRWHFCIWAPRAHTLELHFVWPTERIIPLEKMERGYYRLVLDDVSPGSRYYYRIDGVKERPDPSSRFQPKGVHGPSEVIDPYFKWSDHAWAGHALHSYIVYEVHVGAFTKEGTFDAMIPLLTDLKDLGVTAIELMPVAQFPGSRNWGYDGAYPFAVHDTYGGPAGLKRLANACHAQGLAVILDVAYNHLGPEGNYLADFGPYFTDRYKTPWGDAVNFDGADSTEVRRFFLSNALYWITDFHIDSLRLDAVHAIYDFSARTFLEELAVAVHQRGKILNRHIYLIAESDLNDVRLIRPREQGGLDLDAQWNDDFHHSLHALLTNECGGYYQDFGEFRHIVKAFQEGFVYSGEYSQYRRRRQGSSSREVPGSSLVVFSQNHDQIGNRMMGERLSCLVAFEDLKLAAGAVLLSPFVPLLFMGEEYGETAPFLYFISHLDPDLVEAVRKGRREEFAAFGWRLEFPDPQSEATFERCKLNREAAGGDKGRMLREFYRELIRLRKCHPSIGCLCKQQREVVAAEKEKVLSMHRCERGGETWTLFNFGVENASVVLPPSSGKWEKLIDSSASRWGGPRSPMEERVIGGSKISINARSLTVFAKDD